MNKHPFSMVEILLALGVVAIGVCSVMVLFPVGSNATRDSVMEFYAANAADQMLHMLEYKLSKNYTYTDNIDTSKTYEPISLLEDLEDDTKWPPEPDPFKDFLYQYKPEKKFYQIKIQQEVDNPDPPPQKISIIDFRAIAQLWKEKIQMKLKDPNSPHNTIIQNIPYDKGTRLNIEISWPAQLPYNARQKALYTLEIFKQGN